MFLALHGKYWQPLNLEDTLSSGRWDVLDRVGLVEGTVQGSALVAHCSADFPRQMVRSIRRDGWSRKEIKIKSGMDPIDANFTSSLRTALDPTRQLCMNPFLYFRFHFYFYFHFYLCFFALLFFRYLVRMLFPATGLAVSAFPLHFGAWVVARSTEAGPSA